MNGLPITVFAVHLGCPRCYSTLGTVGMRLDAPSADRPSRVFEVFREMAGLHVCYAEDDSPESDHNSRLTDEIRTLMVKE